MKFLALLVALYASLAMAEDVVVDTTTTNAIPIESVRIGRIVIDVNALQETVGASNSPAIIAPYRWIGESNKVVRTGTARITAADMRAILGDQAAQAEIDRFLGLLGAVVRGVVK